MARLLLIGNSRWHWAEPCATGGGLHCWHTPPADDLEAEDLQAWAAVGSLPGYAPSVAARRLALADVPLQGVPPWLGIDRALAGWQAWRHQRAGGAIGDQTFVAAGPRRHHRHGPRELRDRLRHVAKNEKVYRIHRVPVEKSKETTRREERRLHQPCALAFRHRCELQPSLPRHAHLGARPQQARTLDHLHPPKVDRFFKIQPRGGPAPPPETGSPPTR